MNEAGEEERPRGGNPLMVPVRFVLHWLIKLVVLVVLGIRTVLRPRAVRYGLPVLLVGGAIGWQLFGASLPGLRATPMVANPSTTLAGQNQSGGVVVQNGAAQSGGIALAVATNQPGPSGVVENYLQAEAAFDGRAMWGLLGSDMQTALQQSNGIANAQQLQTQLDSAKQSGRKYLGATYVGGMPLDGGANVYFYVVKVQDATNGTVEVPYIYVIGPDGKIASIQ